MADIDDVSNAIASLVSTAVYPNGISQPSVSGAQVRIFPGWPLPSQLDADMAAGISNVSIFPMAGATATPFQILDEWYTIVPPVHGMVVSVAGNSVTLTGTPGPTEFCAVVLDNKYSFSRTGGTSAAILSAVLADIQVNYPSSSLLGSTLTIVGAAHLVARVGSQGTIGRVVHRQRQGIMVTVWAPTPTVRTLLAAPISVSLSANVRVSLPDTTQMIMVYNRTSVIDAWEAMTIYRRDMIVDAEYATIEQIPGIEVTSVDVKLLTKDTVTGNVISRELDY